MPHFINDTINIASLPKYEDLQLQKPHDKYWKIIVINLGIFLGILGVGATILMFFVKKPVPQPLLIVGLYILLTIILFVLFRLSFKNRGYAFRTHDVIYKSGIIVESTTIVPLNRIQHIELNEGIFSRMYHLGTLQIFSAGGQTGHIRISGIPIDEAKSIRDLLLRKLDLANHLPTENAE